MGNVTVKLELVDVANIYFSEYKDPDLKIASAEKNCTGVLWK